MNKTQINKLRMFESVRLVLKNHEQIFNQLPDVLAGQQRLEEGIQQIGRYRQVQETDNSGLTETKTDLRSTLVSREMQLVAALSSHAIRTGNKELKAKVTYTKSKLMQVSDPVLYDIGVLLVNQATPLADELSRYFVTREKLTELSALLDSFHAAIPQHRVASSMSKVSTSNINGLINSISRMLKEEKDILMLLFEESHPDFYRAYKNARIIVDYTGRGKTSGDESTPPPPEMPS